MNEVTDGSADIGQFADAVSAPGIDWSGGMVPVVYRVENRHQEIADTMTLDLEPVNSPCISFLPGQFTMLGLPGVGEIPISISGNPRRSDNLAQTIRGVGKVSQALIERAIGDRILLRGPFGRPWPVDIALGKRLIVIAGGLGLAPVRPIIYWALANRNSLTGIDLVYGARSPKDIPFGSQLIGWLASDAVNTQVIVDRQTDDWVGRVGPVTDLIGSLRFDPAETVVMICGPEIMMRFVIQALEARGIGDDAMWVSMERNMKCGIGLCGHCQMGPTLICRDGAVYRVDEIRHLMTRAEL